MAALATSAVAVLDTWTEGGLTGKRHIVKRVTLTLTGQGTTTNPINAVTLGFNRLLEASNAVDAANGDIYIPAVSADGLFLLLNDPSDASNAPGDITDTITLNVKGIA